jgi:hypothetical protein
MRIRLILGGLVFVGIGVYAVTNYSDPAVHNILGWPFIIGGIVIFIFGILGLLRRNQK